MLLMVEFQWALQRYRDQQQWLAARLHVCAGTAHRQSTGIAEPVAGTGWRHGQMMRYVA